ncbi:DNA replication/repair protein RecF [Nioella sediminis]|uniref:DNA replication/repair protein RecF n=1 Tax=Nioella sediminis TaxID=1912092 RepID=UPI0008FD4245|nr:DNA replication/repair protein RecF [Nioella sediminis]TBX28442.1 recombinase RecF [Roseovarius sp. JS7-11]
MAGTYVRALSLSHFRSHKRAAMVLDGRPVALFGPNGAGKTNILEAVSLLSPGRGLRRAAAEEMARRPEALGWKIRAELVTGGRFHELEIGAEAGQSRSLKIDGKPEPQLALAGLARIVWLIPAQDRLWIEGAEGRRRFLDRMTMSFFPDHGEAVLTHEKAMRERNRMLKDMVRDAMWYEAVEAQMSDAAERITRYRAGAVARLTEAQEGAETAFPVAELSLIEGEGSEGLVTADDFATAHMQSRPRDMAAGRSLIGPHRSDLGAVYAVKQTEARLCSTGEQKALLISLILANARALKAETGVAPLVLLDEVAAHLDAGRRAALFDEICALGGQAWMTGTGPELFAELGDRAQAFEITEADGQSAVREWERPT